MGSGWRPHDDDELELLLLEDEEDDELLLELVLDDELDDEDELELLLLEELLELLELPHQGFCFQMRDNGLFMVLGIGISV